MSLKKHHRLSIYEIIAIVSASIGFGMILAMIIPFWIWIILIGAGLIYLGYYIFCS